MFIYKKNLQYPVRIANPNPALAKVIISQYGGPNGELGASLRYLSQRFAMPSDEVKGILTDIGTEELGHLEMVGSIVHQLTRNLTPEEIKDAYEKNTGLVIIEEFKRRGIDPAQVPAVLVHNHGPFTWGKDADEAVYHAVVLEEVAFMNFHAKLLNPTAGPMPQVLLDKHYLRKHGANAYYGQG